MPNVAELIRDHVTLTVDCVDRLYLNAYVPRLQTSGGVIRFLGRGDHVVPSPALFGQITEAFRKRLSAWCEAEKVRFIEFRRGERKDDVVQPYRSHFPRTEGLILVGVAQEKASSWTATKTTQGGRIHFDFYRRAVSVNHYYFYFIDREWGPGFLKVCSYAPFAMKLCLNAHEWAKRQASKRGIVWSALDNGFRSCADPVGLQSICDSLTDKDIEACFERWLNRLPLPLTAGDAEAGFSYHLSILQMEVSRTQVFDRPLRGREFFEEVIRDNLDLGRPNRVQLIFERRVSARTPGRFSTRIVTQGVVPSLHIEYKRCHIKQYFKEARALRTETTFNDTYDLGVQRGLRNFAYLRTLGQRINGRLLALERVAHDCGLSDAQLASLVLPTRTIQGQAAPGLRFGQPRVNALLQGLCLFSLTPEGITNGRLRPLIAQLLGLAQDEYSARQMGYDLRRLARKGLIRRIDHKLCYTLTPYGRRAALFLSKVQTRILRPGLQAIDPDISPQVPPPLREAAERFDCAVDVLVNAARLAA